MFIRRLEDGNDRGILIRPKYLKHFLMVSSRVWYDLLAIGSLHNQVKKYFLIFFFTRGKHLHTAFFRQTDIIACFWLHLSKQHLKAWCNIHHKSFPRLDI